jgi:mono/diheme cytochrome c family protein
MVIITEPTGPNVASPSRLNLRAIMKAFLSLTFVALLPALASAAESIDYLRDVKPLLLKNCISCHGPDKQRGSLRLDTAASAIKGGDTGAAVVPGKGAESLLIQAVSGVEGVKAMPPKGTKLSAGEIALVRAWIDGGAKHPADEIALKATPIASKHWSFQAPVRPTEPMVKNGDWCRNPIDEFILARLEKEGVKPSPEADRITLIRRLSLDLTGLPPSLPEIDAFVKDTRFDAYERLVDRLLASPHYGERWGRHWLDAARYADSNGYSIDAPRTIWKYRDWVIDAINQDLPFDQFAIQQLAGDMLPNATLENKIATGFHRNTQINEEGGIDLEQFRVESIVDRVNTVGTVFLGLTVGCCQCHDHKFDPIAQREYYQLFAFLNNMDEPKLELATPEEQKRRKVAQERIAALEKRLKILDATTAEKQALWEGHLSPESKAMLPEAIQKILAIAPNGRNAQQLAAVQAAFRKVDQTRHVVGGLANPVPFVAVAHVVAMNERLSLEKQIAALKKNLPAITTTMVVSERKTPRSSYIMLGGDFTRKGAVVTPGTPAVLPPLTPTPLPSGERGRGEGQPTRLDLAKWLVDPKNPLTARVTMNRFWLAYFGTGIVETDNDFGTQGTPPTHPELLDWLATEFISKNWSMKALHKTIVLSATYRQSSNARPDLNTLDARNRLLARQNRLRLDAEIVRDVALSASGLLNATIGGPSVYPPQPPGVYNFTQVPREWKPSSGPDRYRRGMYTFFWRSAPHPGLTVFDAPDATSTCTRRNRSNTPLQALTLLNDQAFFEFAQGLALRVLKENKSDDESLVYAFRLCMGRPPKERERAILTKLLDKQMESFKAAPKDAQAFTPADLPKDIDSTRFAAWTSVARALLNLDEFITRE